MDGVQNELFQEYEGLEEVRGAYEDALNAYEDEHRRATQHSGSWRKAMTEYPYHCDVCGCRVLDYGFHVHAARMRVVEVARAWRRDDVSGLEHLSLRHSLFAAVDHLDELLAEQLLAEQKESP